MTYYVLFGPELGLQVEGPLLADCGPDARHYDDVVGGGGRGSGKEKF
jgi:hypothetical protein